MRRFAAYLVLLTATLCAANSVFAQLPAGGSPKPVPVKDTAVIFTPSHPLIDDNSIQSTALMNSWGFDGFFNDFGWGLGFYYRRIFSDAISGVVSLDLGSAKGPKEFGFYNEIKVNRIYVIPVTASLQYRVLQNILGAGLRPYLTVGAGPVVVATTDGQRDFFAALGSPQFHLTYGIDFGLGAYFGLDPKSTFGASLKYYFIPYPSPGVESTLGTFVNDFSALSLNVSYGFNF
ncbi:MAG TPA: hypothetical protein VEW28_03255 [Candidatus Kapabacteria bacterium]|nr:hypothetical protein [Candidatus Kapabacteria bacterium]